MDSKLKVLLDNLKKYDILIKYIDEDKFEVFKEHLIKWYNANKYNNYNGYEINVV